MHNAQFNAQLSIIISQCIITYEILSIFLELWWRIIFATYIYSNEEKFEELWNRYHYIRRDFVEILDNKIKSKRSQVLNIKAWLLFVIT
jgi:hypothetical protein